MEIGNSSEAFSEKVICEEWKTITGYEGFYEISNFGRVRSVDRVEFQKHWQGGVSKYIHKGKYIKPTIRNSGYLRVSLHKNGKSKTFNIHRLVALHFLPIIEGKNVVNHKDSNILNNRVDNLEWCTQSENILHGYRKGRKIAPHKKKVNQYDKDGKLVKTWDSLSDAERKLKIYSANIRKVCQGERKQAGGFTWQFTN